MDNNTQQAPQGGTGGLSKVVVAIIAAAVLVWGLVALQKNKKSENQLATSQTGSQNYKLGAIQPLTGDAASFGEVFKNVMQLAVEEINGKGGINGGKIELVLEDSKCNGKDATSAVQKLVNTDKVAFIIGGLCSAESLAGVPVAQTGKAVMVSNGSTSPKLTGISPYFFRLVPSDNIQGEIIANASLKKNFKTVAFLTEQTDYAVGLAGVFKEKFETGGGKVISEEFPQKATDFRTQLAKLKSQNPDALFINGTGAEVAARIIKQINDLGWKAQILLNESAVTDAQFLEANKESLEGALGVEYKVNPDNPKYKELVSNYQKRFGAEIRFNNFSAATYDAVYLFAEGVKQAGYDGEKLSAWSRTIKNWPGATGSVSIKPDGDSESAFELRMVKNGKLEPFAE